MRLNWPAFGEDCTIYDIKSSTSGLPEITCIPELTWIDPNWPELTPRIDPKCQSPRPHSPTEQHPRMGAKWWSPCSHSHHLLSWRDLESTRRYHWRHGKKPINYFPALTQYPVRENKKVGILIFVFLKPTAEKHTHRHTQYTETDEVNM